MRAKRLGRRAFLIAARRHLSPPVVLIAAGV